MYLYLFDFIPDHFLSVSGVFTGRNYLLTGDFCPDYCTEKKKGKLQRCGSMQSGIWVAWVPLSVQGLGRVFLGSQQHGAYERRS